MTAQLRLFLSCQDVVEPGDVPVAAVRLVNEGPDIAVVSSRLNLFEGDMQLIVVDPAGRERRGTAPFVFDGEPRSVGLPAGAVLESGVNVHFTSAGFSFEAPGLYVVSARFDATADGGLTSNGVLVTSIGSSDAATRQLTSQPEVASSLAVGQATSADVVGALETLAAEGAARERFLARMALAFGGGAGRVVADIADGAASLHDVALWATAASPPGLGLGGLRLEAVAASLDEEAPSRVAAILAGDPWPAPI